MTKKEAAKLTEEMNKLEATLGGMRKMKRVPAAIFIIDPHRERIAVTEANKLEIPVVGAGDTNVDPDELDYIIPANDDAIRAIRLLCAAVADAAIEGARERSARAATEPEVMEPMAVPESDRRSPAHPMSWSPPSPVVLRSPSSRTSTMTTCCPATVPRAWSRSSQKSPPPKPARRTSPPNWPARRPSKRTTPADRDTHRGCGQTIHRQRRPRTRHAPRTIRRQAIAGRREHRESNGHGGYRSRVGQGTA